MVLLKKACAGHFTEGAPEFLRRFHWRFLAQNLIFQVYHKSSKFKYVSLVGPIGLAKIFQLPRLS